MAPTNLRMVKHEQTTQVRAPAAIVAYPARSDARIGLGPIPVFKGRYLDVDGILERSLPGAFGQQFYSGPRKEALVSREVPALGYRPVD